MDSQNDRLVDDANASRCEASGTKGHARRQRHEWKVSAAFSGALLLLGCNGMVPSKAPSYRYKETVVVETPQGIRTGSSVIEVQMVKVNYGDHTNMVPGAYRGQAVAVDLPGGQILFALLSSKGRAWAMHAYQDLIPHQPYQRNEAPDDTPEIRQYRLAMALKGPQVVPRTHWVGGFGTLPAYPTLVRFRNIADPATVEEVDPDNLSKSFGPGYKLESVTLAKTDEPVSDGLEKKMRWLSDTPENTLVKARNFNDYSLAATLSRGSFSTFGGFFRGS